MRNNGKSQGSGTQRKSVHVWAKSIPQDTGHYRLLSDSANNRIFQYTTWEQSIPYETNCNSTHLPRENLRGLEKNDSPWRLLRLTLLLLCSEMCWVAGEISPLHLQLLRDAV